MLQLTLITLLGYFEFFLLRRWLLGSFEAQRPIAMLRDMPLEFVQGELLALALALLVAFGSLLVAKLAPSKSIENKRPSIVTVRFGVALALAWTSILAISLAVDRIMLGT